MENKIYAYFVALCTIQMHVFAWVRVYNNTLTPMTVNVYGQSTASDLVCNVSNQKDSIKLGQEGMQWFNYNFGGITITPENDSTYTLKTDPIGCPQIANNAQYIRPDRANECPKGKSGNGYKLEYYESPPKAEGYEICFVPLETRQPRSSQQRPRLLLPRPR